MANNKHPLCPECIGKLSFLDPAHRCAYCFCETEKGLCDACKATPAVYKRCAAVFEYLSPASIFVKALKYERKTSFAKTMASFMVLQLENLKWPSIDYIVPVPQTILRKIERGFNQSYLIGKEMSDLLNVPILDILKRKLGGFSQNQLLAAQRETLSSSLFSCKQVDLSDKTLLLIDDVMTTSSTLRRSAEALQTTFPKAIYTLAFCFSDLR